MPASLADCLEAQQEPLKAALIELVRIPSVCEEGTSQYPFGEAIDRALRKALQIAEELGFRTHYGEGGYYGYAETGGEDAGKQVNPRPCSASSATWTSCRPAGWKTGRRDPFDPGRESDGAAVWPRHAGRQRPAGRRACCRQGADGRRSEVHEARPVHLWDR